MRCGTATLTIDASIAPMSVPKVMEMVTSHLLTGGRSVLTTGKVVAPGLLTTVQDTRGRPDLARYGVPAAGAMDPFAAAAANALVGNEPDAALLEITVVGPTLRFTTQVALGLAGADLSATVDSQSVSPGWSWLARAGSTLSFGDRRSGARAYLACAGGLDVPAVLGSRAADVRAGFSGLAGRAVRGGDRLPLRPALDVVSRCGRYLAAGGRDNLADEDHLDLGPRPRQAKGSVWVLEAEDDRFVKAVYVPPAG